MSFGGVFSTTFSCKKKIFNQIKKKATTPQHQLV